MTGFTATIVTFTTLRWRLLRGAIRGGGTEQVGVVLSTVASGVIGLGAAIAVALAGQRSADPTDLAVAFCTIASFAMLGFGIVAGVSQPIDPRVVAAEPLLERDRNVGLLAGSAFGPPGLAAIAIGAGLVIGVTSDVGTAAIAVPAAASWLVSLLLLTRTATNLLAVLTARFPRTGQLVAGMLGLGFYGLFQIVPLLARDLGDTAQDRLLGIARLTPPGLIGNAMGTASDDPARALAYLAVGSLWLPLLWIAFVWSAARLATTTPRGGGVRRHDDTARTRRAVQRLCGDGAAGAIAWRSLLTRFRTPRTALETVTGAGVGMAAVLVPTLLRDTPGSGAVLVGGAVQLAVLFMAGNSFGIDGPAVTHELLAGAEAGILVRGKVRSIVIVAAPLAAAGPMAAAALTGEWQYLPAGFFVGFGSLLAGTGAAVVQSAYVPIAVPESDNPFVGGESGQGMLAAFLLFGVLTALAVVTVPLALLLFWASDRGQVGLTTAFGGASVVVGLLVTVAGTRIATRRLDGRGPEFVAAVTPAR